MTDKPPYLLSPQLSELSGISHGFFGRRGGVSIGKYRSLNAGHGSDDRPDNIRENRKIIANALGVKTNSLLSVYQHHSTDVMIAKQIWDNQNPPKADAIVTNIAGIACSALAADCAPILFADPVARVIGAAHAGWRGALAGITDNTVLAMISLGAKMENITATIGPCISQNHFEVGPEFVENFLSEHKDNLALFNKGKGNRSYFDIKTYLVNKLLRTGIKSANALPACSYGQNEAYFSYRYNTHRGISDYGRNISAIMIKNE